MDIYQQIYNRFIKLTDCSKPDCELNKNGNLKIKVNAFMDLVIEKLEVDHYSMTHYFEQNGDLVPDPDMEIKIHHEKKMAEALSYQDQLIYQVVYPKPGYVDLKLKKDLNKFLLQWLKNLELQGFYNGRSEKNAI